jgi:hypothetical protein
VLLSNASKSLIVVTLVSSFRGTKTKPTDGGSVDVAPATRHTTIRMSRVSVGSFFLPLKANAGLTKSAKGWRQIYKTFFRRLKYFGSQG